MLDSTKWQWPGDYLRRRDGIDLLPYAHGNIPDYVFAHAYKKMVEDHTLHHVFTDRLEDLRGFLLFMTAPGTHPVFCYLNQEMRGFAWFSDVSENCCTGHFCFFKESWGKSAAKLADAVLSYWFAMPNSSGAPLFDVIIGKTPSENRLALRFIRKLGFVVVGEIPKIASGDALTVSYLEREHYGR